MESSFPESVASANRAIAFLFSDIEGSTERWDRYREAMQDALRRHDRILRTVIESHGGSVFKTIGDAFCAAFPDVGTTLEAAIDGQRRLASEDFVAVGGLRVRMAVHFGEAQARDDDYFGPAVNGVARLLAAGHGGQVLVSGNAADEAASRLPPDVGLRSLGMLPLRGFRQAQRVFQLTAPGMRSAFKPLRALERPPNNLPRSLTSFVGRETDVAGVEAMLRANSLTTIVGTGGVGKTRLAVEAATDVLEDLRDGAWFVDLAPLPDPNLVASAILSALGADQTSGAPAGDVLVAYLKRRELLLVLDNCEHLIGEVARIVDAVLSNCPQITFLATSREALNLAGEQVYRLSSLGADDAVELFFARAQAVNPAFRIDDANRSAVEDLCRRLDGIALAIELAAARMRAISLEELSRRLRLSVLSGGPRDRQARQQTMHALVDWSYQLLTEDERHLFRDVSVFAGGFTLEAAIEVHGAGNGDPFDVLDRFTSLVDKSLLVAETRGSVDRYRLLEPIREYARERLDAAGDAPDVLRRQAQTFAAIADRAYVEWDTSPEPDWLARARLELDNVRVALEWALGSERDVGTGSALAGSAGPIFLRLSLLHEGVEWAERALRFTPELTPGTSARIQYVLSMLYHNQGANAAALTAARHAVELYREAGDARGLTRALSQVAHHLDGAPDEARSVAEEAVRRARAIGDPRLLAATLQRCAFVYSHDIERAARYFEEAVALFRSLGRDDETARALTAWADAESMVGNFGRAAEIASEALALSSDGERMYIVIALASLSIALRDEPSAARYGREALGLVSQRPHPIATPLALHCAAARASGTVPTAAARLLGYAQTQFERHQWRLVGSDCVVEESLVRTLEESLSADELGTLRAVGSALSEAEALALAVRS